MFSFRGIFYTVLLNAIAADYEPNLRKDLPIIIGQHNNHHRVDNPTHLKAVIFAMTRLYFQTKVPEKHHIVKLDDWFKEGNVESLNQLIARQFPDKAVHDPMIARNTKLIGIIWEHQKFDGRLKAYLLFFMRKTMSDMFLRDQNGDCCVLGDEWFMFNIMELIEQCQKGDYEQCLEFLLYRFSGAAGSINGVSFDAETCHEEHKQKRKVSEKQRALDGSEQTPVFDMDALPSIGSEESTDPQVIATPSEKLCPGGTVAKFHPLDHHNNGQGHVPGRVRSLIDTKAKSTEGVPSTPRVRNEYNPNGVNQAGTQSLQSTARRNSIINSDVGKPNSLAPHLVREYQNTRSGASTQVANQNIYRSKTM